MAQNSDVAQILKKWPEAKQIRYEGKCPSCKYLRLFSFRRPVDIEVEKKRVEIGKARPDEELCGYVCLHCDFSNAGARYKH